MDWNIVEMPFATGLNFHLLLLESERSVLCTVGMRLIYETSGK